MSDLGRSERKSHKIVSTEEPPGSESEASVAEVTPSSRHDIDIVISDDEEEIDLDTPLCQVCFSKIFWTI